MKKGNISLEINTDIVEGPRGLSIKEMKYKETLANGNNIYQVILENNVVIGEVECKKGDKGDTGEKGEKGDTGKGILSVIKARKEGIMNYFEVQYTDGSTWEFAIEDGENAYDIAVNNGFEGTEEEWLLSLMGPRGKSLEFNWNGTELGLRIEGENSYIYADLKGEKGDQGIQGPRGEQGIQGPRGEKGDMGAVGPKGEKGDIGATGTTDWKGIINKPSTFTPTTHNHQKSEILNFPISLKNPASLTIQTNGVTQGIYDGEIARIVNITASNIGALPIAGGTMQGNIVGQAANTISGFGKVYNAVFNDYAEFFPRGEDTEIGDIIALDEYSKEEKYIKATSNNKVIIGIHSGEFAHLIGGEEAPEGKDFFEHNIKRYIPVGLIGRCHCKFIGKAEKGMKVVPSNIPGVGKEFNQEIDSMYNIVGYVIENNLDKNIKLVKIKLNK